MNLRFSRLDRRRFYLAPIYVGKSFARLLQELIIEPHQHVHRQGSKQHILLVSRIEAARDSNGGVEMGGSVSGLPRPRPVASARKEVSRRALQRLDGVRRSREEVIPADPVRL
jgi:hypothetical protein